MLRFADESVHLTSCSLAEFVRTGEIVAQESAALGKGLKRMRLFL
jgi:hypothetical protein